MEGRSNLENREPLTKRLFFLAIPLVFIVSLILGLQGYISISIFFGSVLSILIVYRLDISGSVFGINIKRWNLWFGIEVACGFFYFAHLNLIRNYLISDFLSTYFFSTIGFFLFLIPLVFSIFFILFREFYLAPKRLREYLDENQVDIKKQKKIKKGLRRQELGILVLAWIIAFGLGRFVEIAVIIGSILFLYKILKIELKNRRFKSSTEKFFETHAKQQDSFWINFSKLPSKFLIAFVMITFVCFFNIPAAGWGVWISQDLIVALPLAVAVAILIIAIKFKSQYEKHIRYVSVILTSIIAISILAGNPTIFPSIRGITGDLNLGADVQYFLLFGFIWLICLTIFFLNDINQKESEYDGDSKNKKRNMIKVVTYLLFTLGSLVLLFYGYQRIEIPQIKVLLLFGIALLLTLPLINKVKRRLLY